MAEGGHPAGPAGGSAFDLATAVRGGPERWTAEVDPAGTGAGWPNGGGPLRPGTRGGPGRWTAEVDPAGTVAGRPTGGYLLALATRPALEAAGQPHPLAVSAHFLAPADLGPAELEGARLGAGRGR